MVDQYLKAQVAHSNPRTPTIRVSIVIPCYNRENLLAETLDSVRLQTFPAWEVIVVDDHSEDGSLQVAQRFANHDSRFRAERRKGLKGANTCRNQGFRMA